MATRETAQEVYKPIKANKVLEDILISIRANSRVIYVVTSEEERFLKDLHSVIWDKSHPFNTDRNNELWLWSCGSGLRQVTSHHAYMPYNINYSTPATFRTILKRYFPDYTAAEEDLMAKTVYVGPALGHIQKTLTEPPDLSSSAAHDDEGYIKVKPPATHRIVVLADLNRVAAAEITGLRKLKDMLEDPRIDKKVKMTFMIISNSLEIPKDLAPLVEVFDYSLPDRDVIKLTVDRFLRSLRARQEQKKLTEEQLRTKYTDAQVNEIINACLGLSLYEIGIQISKSQAEFGFISPEFITKAKEQIVRKSDIINWVSTNTGLDSIGGMKNLKEWLAQRGNSFSDEARKFGIQPPKGLLAVGIPGTGKSLMAKAVGTVWGMPLLHLDIGKVMSGIIGSSEARAREAIRIAEAVAPCVLWIDEIERGLSGTGSSNFSDGGTMDRVVGYLLNWMQEKKSDVFVIATANDISKLPPQLLRKGRFDEIFFVDLPGTNERKDIFKIHIKMRNQESTKLDLDMLAQATVGYSGSEIEAAINDSMHLAYNSKDRKLTNSMILSEIRKTIPLSESMNAQIEDIKKMAARMRFASDESLNADMNKRGKTMTAKPGASVQELTEEGGEDGLV